MNKPVILTVFGIPRTKKNSQRIIRIKGRVSIQQSAAYKKWEKTCIIKLANNSKRHKPIDYPVNCKAVFYREKNIGDAVNFYQGIADLLEKHNILVDDKHIRTWDGSKLLKDPVNPRVEITLSETKD